MERPDTARSSLGAVLVALGLFVVYTANGRAIGAGDTVPATFLAVALVRGDGPVLDRFDGRLRESDGRLPGYATDARGHAVSRYPIGPALVAAPLVAPQVWLLDRLAPGWERDDARACERVAKAAAAALVALTAAVLVCLLHELGLGLLAVPAVLIVALGTDDLSTASQALWQHGPAELCLALTMLWLATPAPTWRRLAAAGFSTALMVVCRPIDLVFAAVVGLWVLTHHDRRERWAFLAPALMIAVLNGLYNVWFFDTLTGGYAAIEKMHPWAHGTRGTWTAPFFVGAAGTLFSPSHGLFLYSPGIALALGLLPWSLRLAGWTRPLSEGGCRIPDSRFQIPDSRFGMPDARTVRRPASALRHAASGIRHAASGIRHAASGIWHLESGIWHLESGIWHLASGIAPGVSRRGPSLVLWLLWGLVPYFVLLSKYSCWWAGHCFGPRFWIDANPIFAVALALGLEWSWRRCRPALAGFALLAAVAIALQGIGVLCYPSSWHGAPNNADRHHERLWDWRDSEVTRCSREGPRPRMW